MEKYQKYYSNKIAESENECYFLVLIKLHLHKIAGRRCVPVTIGQLRLLY